MQHVFVLSSDKTPLDPCHPARARKLLDSGRAAIFRHFPFTIILKNRALKESVAHSYRIKIDPGSKVTGIAIVQEESNRVVWAAELNHKGQQIVGELLSRRGIRRSRRARHTRYRPARFDNRGKPRGWLPPSLMSRINNVETWVNRLARYSPVQLISMELVKFDTQVMQDPSISGAGYQQGTLWGYEIREYLLEKWNHACAYCGDRDKPLEIEHIVPKSRGGSSRISNLALACHDCNQKKGDKTASEFGYPEVQAQAKKPLKDAASINASRWALYRHLQSIGFPVECGTGGRTKFNRVALGLPKEHWIDAACVGHTGEKVEVSLEIRPLAILAIGRGKRQMCTMDKYGFPRSGYKPKLRRAVHGFRTGDIVMATVPRGKNAGIHVGRVGIRSTGSFHVGKSDGINHKYCKLLQRSDGYGYSDVCHI